MNRSSVSWTFFAVLGIAALVTFVWSRDADRRAERDVRIREAAAVYAPRIARGVQPHEPLLGDVIPGEAGAAYRRAIAAVAKEGRTLGRESSRPELDATNLRDIVAKNSEALTALRDGAAAASIDLGDSPSRWMHRAATGRSVPSTSALASLAVIAVRDAFARGDGSAAVRCTADLLTFERDLLRSALAFSELQAATAVSRVCDTWTDDRLRAIDRESLHSLSRVLRRFDESLPPVSRAFEGEFLAAIENSAAPSQVAELLGEIERLEPTAAAAWSVRQQALEGVPAKRRTVPDTCVTIECARRVALVRVRSLVVAIAHHLRDPLPALPDPFGDGALDVAVTDDVTAVIRSRGTDDGKRLERTARRD